MDAATQAPSARKTELLDGAYEFVLQHGMTGLSLRPLAEAIGSSPRVLLFLFGSKDGLIAALLAKAREQEFTLLEELRARQRRHSPVSLADAVSTTWKWLARPEHRSLLRLWTEAYTQSTVDPGGPWQGFAEQTVRDWLDVLEGFPVDAQPGAKAPSAAERTLAIAVLRGALLDLLATGDVKRTGAAVRLFSVRTHHAEADRSPAPPSR